MKRFMLFALLSVAASPALAQQRADFWRVREGSPVLLVLGTGGECRGRVARRTEGALAVKLSDAKTPCGARDATVNVLEKDTRSVEHAEPSRHKNFAKRAAAVGLAAGAGLVLFNVSPRASIGLAAGGAEAVHQLNRNLDRLGGKGDGYILYVSHLE